MTTRADRRLVHGTGKTYWKHLRSEVKRDKWLYLLLLPGFIYFIIFKYLPMFGIVIAFENYVPVAGVLGSPLSNAVTWLFDKLFAVAEFGFYLVGGSH